MSCRSPAFSEKPGLFRQKLLIACLLLTLARPLVADGHGKAFDAVVGQFDPLGPGGDANADAVGRLACFPQFVADDLQVFRPALNVDRDAVLLRRC